MVLSNVIVDITISSRSFVNRRSRVRAVVTRGSTGLVGQNTSCKAHKVCISLWPMGWDDVRTRADESILNWQVKKGDGGLLEDLLRLCCSIILC